MARGAERCDHGGAERSEGTAVASRLEQSYTRRRTVVTTHSSGTSRSRPPSRLAEGSGPSHVSALSQLQSEEESLRSEIARLEQSLSDSRARERNAHTRLSSARSAINKDLHKRSQAASEHRTKRQDQLDRLRKEHEKAEQELQKQKAQRSSHWRTYIAESLKLADDLEKLRATVRLANKRNKMKEDSEALEELRAAIQNVYMDSVRHIDIGCIESDSLRQRIDPSGVAQAAHDDLRKCEIEKQELEDECRRISRRSGTERSAGDCDGSAVSHRPRLSNAPHSVEDEGHEQRTEPHREQRPIQSESEDKQISEASTSFVVEELMEEEVVSASHIDANLSSPPMRGDASAPMQLVSVIAEPW